jgi:hypothetical protein
VTGHEVEAPGGPGEWPDMSQYPDTPLPEDVLESLRGFLAGQEVTMPPEDWWAASLDAVRGTDTSNDANGGHSAEPEAHTVSDVHWEFAGEAHTSPAWPGAEAHEFAPHDDPSEGVAAPHADEDWTDFHGGHG